MLINGKHYRTIWMKRNSIYIIDQRLLPHQFKLIKLKAIDQVCNAIKTMMIRGAGAIGAAGAYGFALSILNDPSKDISDLNANIKTNYNKLLMTRPTASDLKHGLDFILSKIKNLKDVNKIRQEAYKEAHNYSDWSANNCKMIGIHGEKLIQNNSRVLTHCNAGWLAFVDFGSALAPIYEAHNKGKNIFVYVDETRPRNQGSNLTAFELLQEKIPHFIIADNAAGFFMQRHKVDIVITGADRIAANGDAANKIGTYEKAVLAKENNIPFYIAAPSSTIDLGCKSGDDIPIEKRNPDEVTNIFGWTKDGKFDSVRTAPIESKAENPAFDITPAKYIKGIITEKGIIECNRNSLKQVFGKP